MLLFKDSSLGKAYFVEQIRVRRERPDLFIVVVVVAIPVPAHGLLGVG